VFSSRRIERATWHNVALRYITGQTHPDHDTICSFRRRNGEAITAAFKQVLKLAREMGVLRVGTVSVDGTHIKANASKHRSVRYDRAKDLEEQLTADIEELLAKAEAADSEEAEDGARLPEEIARRESVREKLREAQRRAEAREKHRKLTSRSTSPTATAASCARAVATHGYRATTPRRWWTPTAGTRMLRSLESLQTTSISTWQ
jgi:hypothetical protein